MGAYSPAPIYTQEIHEIVIQDVLEATVSAMAKEGRTFQGVIYAGLMLTEKAPKYWNSMLDSVIRNPGGSTRLKTDLVDIIEAVITGNLADTNVEWLPEAAVCVVMAAGGYPEKYEKGKVINGLQNAGGNLCFPRRYKKR